MAEKLVTVLFFFKQKTEYEIRPRDWSSDVCSSDLQTPSGRLGRARSAEIPTPTHRLYPRESSDSPVSQPLSFFKSRRSIHSTWSNHAANLTQFKGRSILRRLFEHVRTIWTNHAALNTA